MNPNNKTYHLADEIELTIPYSSFNLLASFRGIMCVALMPHTTHKTNIHTHIEKDEAQAYVLLSGTILGPQVIEITFSPNFIKNSIA